MKRFLILGSAAAVLTLVPASIAMAAPHPSPVAPTHTGQACTSVLAHNPNTGPGGHISDQGGQDFGAVGAAFCGL